MSSRVQKRESVYRITEHEGKRLRTHPPAAAHHDACLLAYQRGTTLLAGGKNAMQDEEPMWDPSI